MESRLVDDDGNIIIIGNGRKRNLLSDRLSSFPLVRREGTIIQRVIIFNDE